MNSNMRLISRLIFLFAFFINITYNSSMSFDFEKILDKGYKSSVEFIFDPEVDYDMHIAENDPIRKNYHKFSETELNMKNGARMKCYTPSKTKTSNEIYSSKNLITKITDDYAFMLLRDSKSLCYMSHIKEWFYKLCPTKSASQVLTYKKKNETTGLEYTEFWSLGEKDSIKFDKNEFYIKETNDTMSQNVQPIPFVIIEDRVAKIFNHDLSLIKNYDVNLEIEFDIEELKQYGDVIVSRDFNSVDNYLQLHPDAKKIPIQRRILKLVNKHLVLLENPFPCDKIFYNNVNLSIIKEKNPNQIDYSFSLFVLGDYVYCFRCEFLLYYNVGDSLFIKNGKFSDAMKGKFKETAYKSRKIVKIIDNQLLKVDKSYPADFNGFVMRNYYFVFDSLKKKLSWVNGKGIVKIKNRLMVGQNTKFREQFKKGDMIVLFNINRVLNDVYQTSTNTKLYEYQECFVEKILSNNLLITTNKCPKVYLSKGDYFIGKDFNSNEGIFTKKQPEKKLMSLIDFYTFESLNINYNNRYFNHGDYLFHPGLIIHKPNETVFRMTIEKISPTVTYLRILFGTDMNFYKEQRINEANDYELIIYSKSGALIRKINESNYNDNIQFHDTLLKSLFQESIEIDIIFKNDAIYFSTSDDHKETSIKIKYPLDSNTTIKYVYFDIKESNNVILKNFEKFNIVERQFLYDIFIFEKRLMLNEDAYWIEEFQNGDYCGVTEERRKTVIEYICDRTGNSDISISEVSESKICDYRYTVVSRNFCNPLHLMKYQIEAAITKTKCVAINNIYNNNSVDYFRNINY